MINLIYTWKKVILVILLISFPVLLLNSITLIYFPSLSHNFFPSTFLFSTFMFLAILINVGIWKYGGGKIVCFLIFKNIEFWNINKNSNKNMNFFRYCLNKIFGLEVKTDRIYYISRNNQISLDGVAKKLFRQRIRESFIASFIVVIIIISIIRITINFLLGEQYLRPLLPWIIFFMMFSPSLACFLLPPIWILEDAQLREFSQQNGDLNLGEKLKKSSLNYFFKFSGVILGYDLFSNLIDDFINFESDFTLLFTFYVFIVCLSFSISASILSTYFYFNQDYRKLILEFRKKIIEIGLLEGTIEFVPN